MATETPSTPGAEVPRRATDDIVSALAERMGARLQASNVFGAPVERDGVTIVPVSTVRFALGGGGGGDPQGGGEGEGGGGMGSATPVGYIELKDGKSRFVPAVHPARMITMLSAAVVAGLLILRPGRD